MRFSPLLLLAITAVISAAPLPDPQQGNMKIEHKPKPSPTPSRASAAAAATATPFASPIIDDAEEGPKVAPEISAIDNYFKSVTAAMQKLPLMQSGDDLSTRDLETRKMPYAGLVEGLPVVGSLMGGLSRKNKRDF
ncbi:hypothetical protein RUND412_009437 [Rhizina undulata]